MHSVMMQTPRENSVMELFRETPDQALSVRDVYVTVIVSLFSAPVMLINVSRDQTVLEGSNMTLVCEATGRPTPNNTWTRVLEDGSNGEVLHQGPTWDFPNINRTDTGTYRCLAYNGISNEASHVFKVNVACKYSTCPKLVYWVSIIHNIHTYIHKLYLFSNLRVAKIES